MPFHKIELIYLWFGTDVFPIKNNLKDGSFTKNSKGNAYFTFHYNATIFCTMSVYLCFACILCRLSFIYFFEKSCSIQQKKDYTDKLCCHANTTVSL